MKVQLKHGERICPKCEKPFILSEHSSVAMCEKCREPEQEMKKLINGTEHDGIDCCRAALIGECEYQVQDMKEEKATEEGALEIINSHHFMFDKGAFAQPQNLKSLVDAIESYASQRVAEREKQAEANIKNLMPKDNLIQTKQRNHDTEQRQASKPKGGDNITGILGRKVKHHAGCKSNGRAME